MITENYTSMPKTCSKCNKQNADSDKYCQNCGEVLRNTGSSFNAYTGEKRDDPSMRYISSQFDSRSIDDTLKDMLGNTTPGKSSGQTTSGNQQRCAYCQIEINGQAVMALNQYWHPEHFKCADCQQPIGIGAFQERDGKAYCGRHSTGGPVCHKCQQDLRGSFLKACGNTFHKECFVCVDCNKSLGSEPFVNKGGSPQCKPCSMKAWK